MVKLTVKEVASLSQPGRYTDGDGLVLFIDSSGRKYWQFRFTLEGKRKDLSLGPERHLSLRDAREGAAKARAQVRSGVDPVAAKRRQAGSEMTFAEAAEAVHLLHKAKWSNGKHQDQWLASLENHVFPLIGSKPIANVTSDDVHSVLSAIWLTHQETARRIKQRIRAVLSWAKGKGLRKDSIDFDEIIEALPRQRRHKNHMAALHFLEVPEFMRELALAPATPVVRAAIEFMILTAVRSANIRFMTWQDVDFDAAVWVVPAEKMKMKRDHFVPLSARAVDLLKLAKRFPTHSDLVFPGAKSEGFMSENTKRNAIRAMGHNVTAHGFRTSFKDWSRAELWEDHLSEFQLAHVDEDKSREAYARDGHLSLRRLMMNEWADFIGGIKAAPNYEAQISWRNGPLTTAVDDGGATNPHKSTVLSLRFARERKAQHG